MKCYICNSSVLYSSILERTMKQNEQYYISTPNSVYMFNPSTFKEQSFYAHIKSKEKDDIAYHDVGEFTQE